MKILEAFGEPIADGGQEAFVFGVLEKMDLTGLQVDCLTAYDCRSEKYKSVMERLGGRVYALNLPFTPGKSRRNIRSPFKAFLQDHHYDVVHIHSGSISVLAIMAAEADKAGIKKVIVHSHASGEKESLRHRILRFIASFSMAQHVDIYCACSQNAAEWKFIPKYVMQTLIIKNGIDTERFKYDPQKRTEMRRKLGLEDNYVIGHVGRFSKEKNHEFLVNVFAAASKNEPASRLLLIGTGDEMDRIRSLVIEKRLGKKVIFTGSIINVEDYLQAMDVFVLPSRFEGLGIAAIEAQCTGLPVVASDAVPIDVDLINMSFLSLSASYSAWAEEIERMKSWNRNDKRSLIKKAGFDIAETAEQIKELYIT